MGTHPIFESDFDCLTEIVKMVVKTVLAVTASMALTTAVVTNAWMQKKQFYPTVVHLTRSSQSMLILYIQAFVLIFLLAKLLGKIFFGTLRQAEAENLMERTWYAIIDTCLAFTMFRDDLSPGFVAAFTIFFMLKGFHWLCEDRVDFMERSPIITLLFKLRITTLVALLGVCDVLGIWYAYERTMMKGASVQLVFGFEYAILLTVAVTAFVKFILHTIDLQSEDPWENKSMYMLYLDLVMSLVRLILYLIFIGTMFKIHTLPIFALRPMYLAIRKFRKCLSDIVLSRRAIAQLEVYPNATEAELANDNICIICREEMLPGSSAKKLPCTHIFHASCLRSWFQRQQTCPTCRLDVLSSVSNSRNDRNQNANRQQRRNIGLEDLLQEARLREQLNVQNVNNLQNVLNQNGVEQQNQNRATAATNSTANNLVNPLHIPSLVAGLVGDPLPPPPPMPPVDLSKLSDEDLELLESTERSGVEARIKHLQEIRTLLDAAVLKMDCYNSLSSVRKSENLSKKVENQEPTVEGETELPETDNQKVDTETIDVETNKVNISEDNLNAEKNAETLGETSVTSSTNPFQSLASGDSAGSVETEDKGQSANENRDELRRRRLAALDNNDLDLD